MSAKILKQSSFPECQISSNFVDLVPHLVEDYCRLRRSAQNTLTKDDCKWKLMNRNTKCSSSSNEESRIRQIEIELYEDPEPTAQEKIALPPSRKLIGLKTHPVYPEFSKERKKSINRLIKKSKISESKQMILTKNLQASGSQIGRINITNQNNSVKRKQPWLQGTMKSNGNSNPWRTKGGSDYPKLFQKDYLSKNKLTLWQERQKFIRKTYTSVLKKREDESKEAFKRLSKPKRNLGLPTRSPWTLTKALQSFTPSQRLMEISKPKKIVKPESAEYISYVKKSALEYIASRRISELAMPTVFPTSDYNPFKISRGALTATPSDRIAALASPRKRVDRMNRKNPFRISHKALYARTTKHIKELAQPKGMSV